MNPLPKRNDMLNTITIVAAFFGVVVFATIILLNFAFAILEYRKLNSRDYAPKPALQIVKPTVHSK